MIRLLTGLPRPNGIGEYVAQLAQVGLPAEIFYRRPMSAAEFERTGGRPDRILGAVRDYLGMRWQPAEAVRRTHVTWEGFGPIYGAATRLLTVHHVLGPSVPWEAWPDGRGRRRWVFRAARRGHRRTVELGVQVVVPSESVRSDLVRLYGADPARVEVIPHRIDTSFFRRTDPVAARARLGLSPDSRFLLHVGVDDGRKNLPGLLELFRTYRHQRPQLRLVQLGRSPVLEAAVAHEPPGALLLRSSVPREQLPDWYSAAEAVVLPTFLEGFGRVALEAMACGSPVVVSDLPVFREELEGTFRGAPPGRWSAWIEELERIRMDPPDSATLRAHVERRFDRDRFDAAYSALYKGLGLG